MLARLSKSSPLSWSRTSSGAVRISSSATTCEKRFSCNLSSSSWIPQSRSIRLFLCRALSPIHIRLQCAMHFSSLALTSSPAFTKVLFSLSNNGSSSPDGKCMLARRSFCKASPSDTRNAATWSRIASLSMSMSSMEVALRHDCPHIWKQTCDRSSASFWRLLLGQGWNVSVRCQDLDTRKLCKYSHGTSPEVWVWTHRPLLIHVHQKHALGTALERSFSSSFCEVVWHSASATRQHSHYQRFVLWSNPSCKPHPSLCATHLVHMLSAAWLRWLFYDNFHCCWHMACIDNVWNSTVQSLALWNAGNPPTPMPTYQNGKPLWYSQQRCAFPVHCSSFQQNCSSRWS